MSTDTFQSMFDTPPAPASPRTVPFEFRGSGSEYFRIWIVNLLLSIVTLGIYSAWAKVRRLRYFHGSTYLDGHAFDYHAEPVSILIGRLITVGAYGVFVIAGNIHPLLNLLLLPLLLAGLPWVIMRSRRFHLRMTSWRGLRFGFHGNYSDALKAYVLWWFAAVFTAGILLPVFLQRRLTYLLDNSAFGSQRARFDVGIGRFYRLYGKVILLALGLILVVALLAGLLRVLMSATTMASTGVVVTSVLGAAAGLLVVAFYQSGVLNLAFGSLQIGPHRVQSTLAGGALAGVLITNALLMVLTLGLYTPWAKVRLLRYQLQHTQLIAVGDLGEFTAAAGSDDTKALGDEISDFFDVDFGI